jgi:peptide/nickel transport system permease protein
MIVLAVIVLALIFAKYLAPYPPNAINMSEMLQSPSPAHPLGTDYLGRDVLSRILDGANTTVTASFMILAIIIVVGVSSGLLSGYAGGRLDWIVMRLVDTSVALPDYIIAIVLSGVLGPGMVNLVIAISAVKWFSYARMTRSIVIGEKQKEYILSAKISGLKSSALLRKHLIPHVASHVAALAVVDVGKTILMIASLSYLGLGIQPPKAEWGLMLNEGRAYFSSSPHLMIMPGLAIFLVVLVVNVCGNRIAKHFDIWNQEEVR